MIVETTVKNKDVHKNRWMCGCCCFHTKHPYDLVSRYLLFERQLKKEGMSCGYMVLYNLFEYAALHSLLRFWSCTIISLRKLNGLTMERYSWGMPMIYCALIDVWLSTIDINHELWNSRNQIHKSIRMCACTHGRNQRLASERIYISKCHQKIDDNHLKKQNKS